MRDFFPIIELKGKPYEMGKAHGRGLAKEIKANLDLYFMMIRGLTGLEPQQCLTHASQVLDVIQNERPQVILMNGGTGITKKDVTIEAVNPLFGKTLTGFGPLFAKLSFDEIGSAAFLSRATAGVIEDTVVFCMPGSLNACKLACRELIFPELGHLVKHVTEG